MPLRQILSVLLGAVLWGLVRVVVLPCDVRCCLLPIFPVDKSRLQGV